MIPDWVDIHILASCITLKQYRNCDCNTTIKGVVATQGQYLKDLHFYVEQW